MYIYVQNFLFLSLFGGTSTGCPIVGGTCPGSPSEFKPMRSTSSSSSSSSWWLIPDNDCLCRRRVRWTTSCRRRTASCHASPDQQLLFRLQLSFLTETWTSFDVLFTISIRVANYFSVLTAKLSVFYYQISPKMPNFSNRNNASFMVTAKLKNSLPR